jgi:hypothetical protein
VRHAREPTPATISAASEHRAPGASAQRTARRTAFSSASRRINVERPRCTDIETGSLRWQMMDVGLKGMAEVLAG